MTAFRIALVLILAIAAAVVANLVLLGVATGSGEPVGRLSPRAGLVAPVSPPAPGTKPKPATTPAKPKPATEPRDSGKHSDD
jgi:hypothetical protein